MSLDDRMLSDIGLTRGKIEQAARHGRPDKPKAIFTDGLAAQPVATHATPTTHAIHGRR
jgi:hypothetical protein